MNNAQKSTIANDIWVATALLQKERGPNADFAVSEIREKVIELNPQRGQQRGLSVHLSSHCVANKPSYGLDARMLVRTQRGRRRLFKEGDPVHESRKNGRATPTADEIPVQYRDLLDWYRNQYSPKAAFTESEKVSRMAQMRRLIGSITPEDLAFIKNAFEAECERLDD